IPPAGGMSLITKWLTHVIRWLYFMSQVAQKDGKAGSIPWQYSGIRILWWKRAYKSPFSNFLISVEKSTP
ncbi:hypothetical protein ACFSCZ_17935, partial [Siminovitchia sediminis]